MNKLTLTALVLGGALSASIMPASAQFYPRPFPPFQPGPPPCVIQAQIQMDAQIRAEQFRQAQFEAERQMRIRMEMNRINAEQERMQREAMCREADRQARVQAETDRLLAERRAAEMQARAQSEAERQARRVATRQARIEAEQAAALANQRAAEAREEDRFSSL